MQKKGINLMVNFVGTTGNPKDAVTPRKRIDLNKPKLESFAGIESGPTRIFNG